MAEVQQVPINQITVGDYALRAGMDDEQIHELSRSIGRLGVIVPLVVSRSGDGFRLIAGHRRIAAAMLAGLNAVPCIVRQDNEANYREVSFAENLYRADLTPVEVASGIKDCINNGVMDAAGVAVALHRTEYWVAKQLAMLDWPDDVLQEVHNGKISVAAASNLALVADDSYRSFLIRNAVESGATARVTAAWLQAWRSMQPPEQAVQAEPVAAGERPQPMMPQAPCLCCGQVYRTDALSHVPICQGCINTIRRAVGT